MNSPLFYLASASPRRRELLAQIGLNSSVLRTNIDESEHPGEAAQPYVERLAVAKAAAGWAQLVAADLPPAPLLAADTTVELDGRILGKPADAADARAMLAALSGREHRVLTAIAVRLGERCERATSISQVWFKPLSAAEIDAYIASGEPFDKAGGYGIQGRAGAFVERIAGSFSGIVGLPLCETAQLLAAFGVRAA